MGASTSWSRRSVLVLAAAGAGTVALSGPLGSAAAAVASPTDRSSEGAPGLRREHWTALVGTRVVVDTRTGRVRARVIGVEDLRSAPAGHADAFAVELRIDRGQADIAGLNPITIPGRGVTTLSISGVDRGIRFRPYQLVVNNYR
jgi:hypothetical protein